MAYQINLTGQEIDERLQNVGSPADNPDANGTLFARLNKNVDDIANIDSRQTNIEYIVWGAQENAYFSLLWLNFVFNNLYFNGNIDNVEVRLYRWSGKRYAQFEMFTRNGTGVSQKLIGYEIILKQEKKDGINVRVPYIHYNDDATEEMLLVALKNAFGGRISYGRHKKRRWRLQAFLTGRPITAPFDFRVSIAHDGSVSLTKEGMMRSVPKAKEVVYDGFFNSAEWLKCKKGEVINCDYNASEKRFPKSGDFIEQNRRGIVVASEYDSAGNYRILWTLDRTLYEIVIGGKAIESSFVFRCTSPAKKLCDDIYDYASKMNSGTLRDLYISAGAKYNETTGYYELNGLTDITEEEMREIYNRYLIDIGSNSGVSGWLLLGAHIRTNLPCITRADIFSGMDNSISGTNVEVLRICAASSEDYKRVCYIDKTTAVAHQFMPKLKKVIGIWRYNNEDPNRYNFGYGQPFSKCPLLEEIRMMRINKSHTFAVSPNLSKESVQYMIENANPPSGAAAGSITITLHPTAYARLKDDADIVAALEAKGGIVTLVSA